MVFANQALDMYGTVTVSGMLPANAHTHRANSIHSEHWVPYSTLVEYQRYGSFSAILLVPLVGMVALILLSNQGI